jgi:hypothetical protein
VRKGGPDHVHDPLPLEALTPLFSRAVAAVDLTTTGDAGQIDNVLTSAGQIGGRGGLGGDASLARAGISVNCLRTRPALVANLILGRVPIISSFAKFTNEDIDAANEDAGGTASGVA